MPIFVALQKSEAFKTLMPRYLAVDHVDGTEALDAFVAFEEQNRWGAVPQLVGQQIDRFWAGRTLTVPGRVAIVPGSAVLD